MPGGEYADASMSWSCITELECLKMLGNLCII